MYSEPRQGLGGACVRRHRKVGVIIAPVFPADRVRSDVGEDIAEIAANMAEIEPHHIYGESLHARGEKIRHLEGLLGERICVTNGFDVGAGRFFHQELRKAVIVVVRALNEATLIMG